MSGIILLERLQTYPTRFVERIQSDQGTFAVKVDTMPALADGSEAVQSTLARRLPRHVPAVIPARSGALHILDDGNRITVLEDIPCGNPTPGVRTWGRLGKILAQLHALPAATRRFAIPVQGAANELDGDAADYPFAEEFRALISRVRGIEEKPTATIHGEINLSNVSRRQDGDLVLLDWDAAGSGPAALDLGYPLICVFHDEDLIWHGDRAAAFYRAYRENSSTEIPSPQQIFDAAVMHAMRYLRFANTAQRWKRLSHAIEREGQLIDSLSLFMSR